jgi:hypothetical protein
MITKEKVNEICEKYNKFLKYKDISEEDYLLGKEKYKRVLSNIDNISNNFKKLTNNIIKKEQYIEKIKRNFVGKKVKIVDWMDSYSVAPEIVGELKLKNQKPACVEDNEKIGVIFDIIPHTYFKNIYVYVIQLDNKCVLMELEGFKLI